MELRSRNIAVALLQKSATANNTRYSQAVTHPSTNRSRRSFNFPDQTRWVYSTWYVRRLDESEKKHSCGLRARKDSLTWHGRFATTKKLQSGYSRAQYHAYLIFCFEIVNPQKDYKGTHPYKNTSSDSSTVPEGNMLKVLSRRTTFWRIIRNQNSI